MSSNTTKSRCLRFPRFGDIFFRCDLAALLRRGMVLGRNPGVGVTEPAGQPFRIFRLMNPGSWIIPPQYVKTEELVLPLRMPDSLRLSRGRGLEEIPPMIKIWTASSVEGTSTQSGKNKSTRRENKNSAGSRRAPPPVFLGEVKFKPRPLHAKGPGTPKIKIG